MIKKEYNEKVRILYSMLRKSINIIKKRDTEGYDVECYKDEYEVLYNSVVEFNKNWRKKNGIDEKYFEDHYEFRKLEIEILYEGIRAANENNEFLTKNDRIMIENLRGILERLYKIIIVNIKNDYDMHENLRLYFKALDHIEKMIKPYTKKSNTFYWIFTVENIINDIMLNLENISRDLNDHKKGSMILESKKDCID